MLEGIEDSVTDRGFVGFQLRRDRRQGVIDGGPGQLLLRSCDRASKRVRESVLGKE